MMLFRKILLVLVLALMPAMMSVSTGARAQDADRLNAPAEAYQKGDYATAYRLWLELAEEGNRGAYYNLGILYQYGYGVTLDLIEAYKWYLLASQAGLLAGKEAVLKMQPIMTESDSREAQWRVQRWYDQHHYLHHGK